MPTGTSSSKVHTRCTVLSGGYCTHKEWVTIQGGSSRTVPFPALFALIEHPRLGPVLFDTGYTERFFQETVRMPYSLYRRMTPVYYTPQDSAAYQLRQRGIEPEDVRIIILSHFHADHIAGLRDFPNAAFVYLQEAYDAVRFRSGWSAVLAGYLPGLLPDDFETRSRPIDESRLAELPPDFPFRRGMDLFGDGSVIAVDVPGHAAGQIGILLSTGSGDIFLCADAVWSSRAFRERRPPHWLAGFIMSSRSEYMKSFDNIVQVHKRYPELQLIPSHCSEVWRSLAQGGDDGT
ncbi:MBL fold metallo-hydrolase [Paenibacillus sp. NPDC056579]|uniref:MBL fold metallo-hydrolase n=1 Tax=Paenibacillus sp. NPDC056579 TaxID=3345871 RepID=UPI00369771FC